MCCDRFGNVDTLTWCMTSAMNPDEDGYYLVTRKSSAGHCIVGILRFEKGAWVDPFTDRVSDVISWTCLPDPYTGE